MCRNKNKPMKIDRKQYFFSLISLLTIVSIVAALFVQEVYNGWFVIIPISFFLLGVLFYYFITKMNKISENRFLSFFMISVFAKFFISILFISLYLIYIKDQKVAFSITFFVFYVVFSIFETNIFLKISKNRSSEK